MLKNFLDRLDFIIGWWCILVMGAMTTFVIASVFLRYVFSLTWVWSEELITFLFISSTFFGAVLATKKNEHISVDFLPSLLKGLKKKTLLVIISLSGIAVQAVILKFSILWISVAGGIETPGFGLPFQIIYSFMPISAGLIILYELIKIILFITSDEKAGA